jgi:hypothetical protein
MRAARLRRGEQDFQKAPIAGFVISATFGPDHLRLSGLIISGVIYTVCLLILLSAQVARTLFARPLGGPPAPFPLGRNGPPGALTSPEALGGLTHAAIGPARPAPPSGASSCAISVGHD